MAAEKVLYTIAIAATCAWAARGRTVTELSGPGWTCDGVSVSVPHTWNAEDACDGPGDAPKERSGDSADSETYLRKRAVYRRALPPPTPGKRQFVRFEGASSKAEVFVNGTRLGAHKGAFTAFCFEATGAMRPDGNVLEVAVDNGYDESFQPMSADFSMYGGLYRRVWLLETDRICIDPVTDGADGVRVEADPATGVATVFASVLGGTNEVRRFKVEGHELWSPESPRVYTRTVVVEQGGCSDSVDVTFAFRTFEFREDGFYLNGAKRVLRGVNRHQDRAGKGWAVSPEDEEEDIRLIREMGADAIRTAHYPQSRHVYDLCDRAGLICWVEFPNVNRVTFSDEFERGMHEQMREMVAQLGNHPSIAMWSVFNELYMKNKWMKERAGELSEMMRRAANHLRRLDPSRRVVAATYFTKTGCHEVNVIPDELGVNVYPGWYAKSDMKTMLDDISSYTGRRAFCLSEYGVGASVRQHTGDPTARPAPGGPWHPEEYQAWRMADNLRAISADGRVWGSFVWAMFDFGADRRTEGDAWGRNDKGLVTFDRKTKKDAYYVFQANWRDDAKVLRLVGSRMESVTNGEVSVMGVSNVGPATLAVNGRVVGEMEPDSAKTVLWRGVRLVEGRNELVLSAGGLSSSAVWNLK